MAFGDIRGTKTGTATSITASFPCATGTNFAVVVGDIIVTLLAEQTSLTVTACTDNLSNVYTPLGAGASAGTVTGRSFYTRVTNAGTISSVTFTATASGNNCVGLAVGFEGPFDVSPVDKAPAGIINDNTTPYTCPATGVLSQANEKIVCAIVHNGNPTLTATAPNLKAVELATASILKAAIGHQTVSSTASVTPAWTSSATPTSSGYDTVSFRQAAISGTLGTTDIADDPTVSGSVAWPEVTGTFGTIDVADDPTMDGTVAWPEITGTFTLSEIADDITMAGDVVALPMARVIVSWFELEGVELILAERTGTLAASEAPDIAAFTGEGDVAGALAASEAPDVAAVSGEARPSILNENDKSTRITLSNGNLTAIKNLGAGGYAVVRSTDSYASGKRYFEGRPDALHSTSTAELAVVGLAASTASLDEYLGYSGFNWSAGYFCDGAVWYGGLTPGTATGKPIAVSEWVGLAVDFATGKVWVRDSTGWQGDPEAGTGNIISFTPGLRLHAATQLYSVSTPGGPDQTTVNFGATAFAYTVPSGFARWTPQEGAAEVTGTLATSDLPDVASLTGTILSVVTGTLGTIEPADAAALTGTVLFGVSGSMTAPEPADTLLLAGQVTGVAGIFAAPEFPDNFVATAQVRWLATLAASDPADTASITGGIVASGPLATTDLPDTAALTGGITGTGTLGTTEPRDGFAATGTVFTPVTGTLGTTEARDTLAATGVVLTGAFGMLATTDLPDSMVAAGTVSGIAGAWASTEPRDVAAGTGRVTWDAVLAAGEPPDVVNFTVTSRWLATLAASDAPDTVSMIVLLALMGTLAATDEPDSAAATGDTASPGVLEATEPPDIAFFTTAPPSIQEAEGHFLRSELPRARTLQSANQRVRILKYPVPRPREMLNAYGRRIRSGSSAGQRTRTLEGA